MRSLKSAATSLNSSSLSSEGAPADKRFEKVLSGDVIHGANVCALENTG
jgi:hypothetical protein